MVSVSIVFEMISLSLFVSFQMEMMDAAMPDGRTMGPVNPDVNATKVEDIGHRVDEMFTKVDKVSFG